MADDQVLAAVLSARGAGKGRGARSPLYAWMRKHYAELKAEFEANGPHWVARTQAMAEIGLTDQDGKPPTVRTAQQTWYRLIREMEGQAIQDSGQPAAPSKRTSPATTVETTAEDEEARKREHWKKLGFGVAKLKL